MFGTRVVRLVRPIGTTDHLLAADTSRMPVRVAEPALTGRAAIGGPVQVWYDAWRRRDRILRYRCRCCLYGWLLWGFDDGENDPRGVLGDFTAGFSLDPADYDMCGPAVGLCCGCANDGDPIGPVATLPQPTGPRTRRREGVAQPRRTRSETTDGRPARVAASAGCGCWPSILADRGWPRQGPPRPKHALAAQPWRGWVLRGCADRSA